MSLTLQFGLPQRNDFVVLYPDKADEIRDYLLDGAQPFILKVGANMCLHPLIVWMTFLRLGKLNWAYVRYSNGTIGPILKQIYELHLLAVLQYVRPKAVISFIDNSGVFQRLSRLDDRSEYFAIQNGGRTVWCAHDSLPEPPHPGAIVSMPNWFCYGKRDEQLFRSFGHQIDNAIPVGSMLAGLYRQRFPRPAEQERDIDLCFISSWHPSYDRLDEYSGKIREQAEGYHQALQLINGFLARYVSERSCTLSLALRDQGSADEKQYFFRQIEDKAEYVDGNRQAFSTYRTIDRSKLVVTINSTTGLDALSWGAKVLFCNPFANPRYSYFYPESGFGAWYLDSTDYNAFKERVDVLLAMSDEEYRAQFGQEASDWVDEIDPDNPPHEKMRKIIRERVGA